MALRRLHWLVSSAAEDIAQNNFPIREKLWGMARENVSSMDAAVKPPRDSRRFSLVMPQSWQPHAKGMLFGAKP
jgi:hypothetical protein